jgi:phosphatidylglycerol:prolipoprotein diacylglycerol transferase
MLLVLPFPDIDPIAVALGPLAIRWYSLAYIVGLVAAWRYCRRLAERPPNAIDPDQFDDFLLWATLGVVLGGRLGYVLFYKPAFFLANPLEILVAVPIGLFLGRLANFVNGELYGRAAQVPWAMVFPRDPEQVPRHPSQLYEAGLEGIVLFLLLYLLVRRGWLERPGAIGGAFLAGYGLARIIVEFFRQPDAHLGFLLGLTTMGQVLSLPMIIAGVILIAWGHRVKRSQP